MLPTAPLAGQEFAGKWRTRSTNDLLAQLRTTMPPESPGSLGEQGYIGIVAFLQERNGTAASDEPPAPIGQGCGPLTIGAGALPSR
jgi:hypothetical protein